MNLKLEHQKDSIISLYNSGWSPTQIANHLGEYLQPVTNLLKAYLPIQSFSLQGTADMHYFDNIDTPLKAYFVGFIAGDGALVESRNSSSVTLTITIHARDRVILETLRTELQMSRSLYELPKLGHVRLILSNKHIVAGLAKVGIGPRKSLTMENFLLHIPEDLRTAAILGYFDADGSCTVREAVSTKKSTGRVYTSIKQSVQIRGTVPLLEGIVNHLGVTSYHISTRDSIANLAISSKSQFIAFFNQVYSSCEFYLPRKYVKFLPIINQAQTISSSAVNDNVPTELGARVAVIA